MTTIYLELRKGRLSGRPDSSYPKTLYHSRTGRSCTVKNETEEAALGDGWGNPQPDVKFPRIAPHEYLRDEPEKPQEPVFVAAFDPAPEEPSPQQFPKHVMHPITGKVILVMSEEQELSLKQEKP